MPPSIGERTLRALMTTLAPVATVHGVRLLPSPVDGVPREASPALLVFPEFERIVARPNDPVDRPRVLRLVALARDTGAGPPNDWPGAAPGSTRLNCGRPATSPS